MHEARGCRVELAPWNLKHGYLMLRRVLVLLVKSVVRLKVLRRYKVKTWMGLFGHDLQKCTHLTVNFRPVMAYMFAGFISDHSLLFCDLN